MPEPIVLSIDAMGGDVGIPVTLEGAKIALVRNPNLRFLLFGDAKELDAALQKFPTLKDVSTVRPAEVSIRMDEKPSQALRKGKGKSSMWLALQAVKDGEAHAAISAGNTGALMAMCVFCVRTMPGISRPAIAAIWPTLRGESIVLDLGASIGAKAQELVQMGMMGAAMARSLFDIDKPTVGLLNIGVEEVKGLDAIKEAGQILKEANYPFLDYTGFVEGDDIGKGVVDVIVTEGYTGNIALKAAEGTAKQIGSYLRSAMSQNLLTKIGYLLAKPAFDALKEKMDPRKVNGGVFLGLNGVVIKSHGGTDGVGFASAIDLASDMVRYGLKDKITASLASIPSALAEPEPPME